MKVYMIGQYQFDGSEPTYRCFYEESDAKRCARELIEESEDDDEEAMEVTNKAVMDALDGLPPVKVHCSLLAEEAVNAALWDYAEKNHIEIKGLKKLEHSEEE